MKLLPKIIASALISVGVAVIAPTAMAAPVDCATGGTGGGPVDTFGEWAALTDGCFNGDKLYIETASSGLAATLPVGFDSFSGGQFHQFTLGGTTTANAILPTPGTASLDYIISVYLTGNTIVSVDLDSTVGQGTGSTEVQKLVYAGTSPVTLLGTLTSINGAQIDALTVSQTSLFIRESFSSTSGSILNTAQNTFMQAEGDIPEPATLALVGLALAGLGMGRRRKA